MDRFRARGVPFSVVAAIALAVIVGGCGGGAGPLASAAVVPPGSAGSSAATPPSASTSGGTAALIAELSAAGLGADDLAFLAATTFEASTTEPGTATVVEHLASGDTTTFTVSIAPATSGSPGLVSATSSTAVDRIEVHLEYLVGADGMPDDVRQSLEAIALVGGLMANRNAGPNLTAEVSVYQVTVDWGISKVNSTLRDTSIKAFLEKVAPGKAGALMRLVKAGFTAEKGAALGDKLDAQLAELQALEECARNPTNPLTIKQYKEEPGARDRVIEQINEARNELIANTVVMQLGVLNSFAAGFGPKWLGYAIGPGTAWSKTTLEELNRQRIDEIKRAVPKCECPLVTESLVEPMTWHGERRNPLDTEWLIQGEANAEGYQETWLYRAVIDLRTKQGTYKYESIGSIASGTLTKNGAGDASVAIQPDGSAILTLGAANVKSTITAAGTTQTITLPVPETAFTWKPLGTSCAPPG